MCTKHAFHILYAKKRYVRTFNVRESHIDEAIHRTYVQLIKIIYHSLYIATSLSRARCYVITIKKLSIYQKRYNAI